MDQKYLSLKETAAKWGISDRRINTLCLENRILGAFKVGNSWAIPADAEKPSDERIKSGKYVMSREKIFDKNVKLRGKVSIYRNISN